MRTTLTACLIFTLSIPAAVQAEEPPLFPFVVTYDAPAGVTNISDWLPKPAGGQGWVRSDGDSLVTDAGPIRFWATNLCFDACFPTHEQAERVAARLAGLGTNCVRMHHMDSRSIWGDGPNHLTIDKSQLDRLDYLIFQLKQHGIYTNLNLHVSRSLGDKEGFSGRDERPKYDKGLGNFELRMIELQKQYARDLLMHVNPYTKMAYTDDPAIAFVEISNEDALLLEWSRGSLDGLPDPYATTFRKLWNAWLLNKYGSTDALREAWSVGAQPLGEEMLADGRFAKPLDNASPWRFGRDDTSQASWAVDEKEAVNRLRLVVNRPGKESWLPQLIHSGFGVQGGEPYTLSLDMRSQKPQSVSAQCGRDHEPWGSLGLSGQCKTTDPWQTFRFTFVATETDDNARISLSSFKPGAYEIRNVSLRPGGIEGLKSGTDLARNSVPIVLRADMNITNAGRRDFIDFLWATEHDYWLGMYRFLKDELGVKSLTSGTQLFYGPTHIQAELDYLDAHAYWHHPSFPGTAWDRNNWFVRNHALVDIPGKGTLSSLAIRQVQGKAYTISEYNHPAPNSYAAEGFPMIAAFGAFQSWDGIFPFTYSNNGDTEPRMIEGYFDVKCHTAKLVHMPACAAMFLRGDVAPARESWAAPVSEADEREILYKGLSSRGLTYDALQLDSRFPLQHGLRLDLQGGNRVAPPKLDLDGPYIISDTGELAWRNVAEPKDGRFVVNAPNTRLFTGFTDGKIIRLGDVGLRIGKTRQDWATVSLVSIDGTGFNSAGRILIAATGLVENQGMKLTDLGDNRLTLGRDWGEAPVMCEGVQAQVLLPVAASRVQCYPLDESGKRRAPLQVERKNGKAVVPLDPKHRTVWYEVVIE